jgi:CheY-like chemotaxis protein
MPRIRLVDDELVAQAVYGEHLSAAGHQVATARSVTEATMSS